MCEEFDSESWYCDNNSVSDFWSQLFTTSSLYYLFLGSQFEIQYIYEAFDVICCIKMTAYHSCLFSAWCYIRFIFKRILKKYLKNMIHIMTVLYLHLSFNFGARLKAESLVHEDQTCQSPLNYSKDCLDHSTGGELCISIKMFCYDNLYGYIRQFDLLRKQFCFREKPLPCI